MFLCSTKCDQRLVQVWSVWSSFKTEKSEYKHIEEIKHVLIPKSYYLVVVLFGVTAL